MRSLSANDDKAIFQIRSNPEVNRYVKRKPCETIDEARNFISTILAIEKNKLFYWGIILKETDELIGTICLANISFEKLTAEIGYELLPVFQNKGFMQACISAILEFGFIYMNFHSIEANTDKANTKSIYLLEKFGFVQVDDSITENHNEYTKYIKIR